MYEVNKPRLLKLIKFLETLKPKQFYFPEVVRSKNYSNVNCGAICCAIGWTPVIFPSLVEYDGTDVRMKNSGLCGEYSYVARDLFGMERLVASDLFCPNNQKGVHPSLKECGDGARPKTVAKMLRHFIKLVEAGEIEEHVILGSK